MASKTRLLAMVKALDSSAVAEALRDSPELLKYRDEKGRNWLHLCCGIDIKSDERKAAESIKIANALLKAGIDINQAAFTEAEWKATPLWYVIARGRNLVLAEHLLKLGSNPNYCLWAAAWNRDIPAIRLLVRYGADVNDSAGDDLPENESPFLFAIKWSHFDSAEELLKLGADVNYQDRKGMTALHYMLKKGSDPKHIAMVVRHGARGDIPDKKGVTAIDLLRRKRDPGLRKLADALLSG